MKQIFKFAILSCLFFLASFESKATNWEFTWINTTICNTFTVTVEDGAGNSLYSGSTCCGSAICLSNVAIIRISLGAVTQVYNTCGDLVNSNGTFMCNGFTITPIVSGCGPAGGTCGAGARLLTVNL